MTGRMLAESVLPAHFCSAFDVKVSAHTSQILDQTHKRMSFFFREVWTTNSKIYGHNFSNMANEQM